MGSIFAVVFDFDDTLARDSTTDFLDSLGVDTASFWGIENRKLIQDGWDPVPAFLFQILEWSSRQPRRITRKMIQDFGEKVRLFDGVKTVFSRLTDFVKKVEPSVNLEFYIISSGLGDMIRGTKIAKFMKEIFASDFAYNDEDEILFPKKIVSFTDKTRYLFQISKGLIGREYSNKPFEVNHKIENQKLRIPFKNMIYVGDGFTDVPCFSLLNKNEGIALAVYDRENREKKASAWGFIEEGRVKNLHSTNYLKGSDLCDSLEMSIENIIRKNK